LQTFSYCSAEEASHVAPFQSRARHAASRGAHEPVPRQEKTQIFLAVSLTGDRRLVFSVSWAPLWAISSVTAVLFSLAVFLLFLLSFDSYFLLRFYNDERAFLASLMTPS
jgi:hypothetical protein